MGLSSIGPGSIAIILLLVVLLFGSKRIVGIAKDLAKGINSFRQGINEDTNNDVEPKND